MNKMERPHYAWTLENEIIKIGLYESIEDVIEENGISDSDFNYIGDLKGIKGLKSSLKSELIPYAPNVLYTYDKESGIDTILDKGEFELILTQEKLKDIIEKLTELVYSEERKFNVKIQTKNQPQLGLLAK